MCPGAGFRICQNEATAGSREQFGDELSHGCDSRRLIQHISCKNDVESAQRRIGIRPIQVPSDNLHHDIDSAICQAILFARCTFVLQPGSTRRLQKVRTLKSGRAGYL